MRSTKSEQRMRRPQNTECLILIVTAVINPLDEVTVPNGGFRVHSRQDL